MFHLLLSQLSHFGRPCNNAHVNFMQHLLGVIKVLEADGKLAWEFKKFDHNL